MENKILSLRKRITKEPQHIDLDARYWQKQKMTIKAAQQLRAIEMELSAHPSIKGTTRRMEIYNKDPKHALLIDKYKEANY